MLQSEGFSRIRDASRPRLRGPKEYGDREVSVDGRAAMEKGLMGDEQENMKVAGSRVADADAAPAEHRRSSQWVMSI